MDGHSPWKGRESDWVFVLFNRVVRVPVVDHVQADPQVGQKRYI